jgi:hypothetical protein
MMSEDTHPVDFEDFSTPCNEQQSQKVLVTPAASSARPNHKRSKNFSEKEDEILVSAWLNVSLDPITGANQTHKSYWTRIHDYFLLWTAASTYGGSRDVAEEAGQAETCARYHQERPATQLDSVSRFIGSYCLGMVIPFV